MPPYMARVPTDTNLNLTPLDLERTAADHSREPPSQWVAHFLVAASPGGSVLDVACGHGRHLRLARNLGFTAVGVDRDLSGLQDLLTDPNVELVPADLEGGSEWPVAERKFDAVITTNYLWRPRPPDIVAAVADNGILIYETFAVGQQRFGHPANPDFLLRPGKLIDAVRDVLVPIDFQHGEVPDPQRLIQRIAAVGPAHRWLKDGPPQSAPFTASCGGTHGS